MNPSNLGCVLLVICGLGCKTTPPPSKSLGDPPLAIRNNAVSLLHDLLGDEKNISKILIIKRDRDELHGVIKAVAKTCQQADLTLEAMAKQDPFFNLNVLFLPPGEKAARAAEGKTRRSELLHASGANFEFQLLLTQVEALGYAQHLALVAAQSDPVPANSNLLFSISSEMRNQRAQVLQLLLSPAKTK